MLDASRIPNFQLNSFNFAANIYVLYLKYM